MHSGLHCQCSSVSERTRHAWPHVSLMKRRQLKRDEPHHTANVNHDLYVAPRAVQALHPYPPPSTPTLSQPK
ncbi:hypothetical protein E2C01_065688 [Portunus trituberculatus]|uniref:Uncharacterized protein n=1 Tax=Portunus trituberculatus TaxID=210409 RepID=A0A5B7HF83_PORTR|nr:hypothetical protein [Portunus trituberculatus]